MKSAKKPRLGEDFVWELGWALSEPDKGSVFDEDVVDFKDSKVFGHYLPANKIFIRGCYKTLAPRIFPLLQHTPGVALLGTPGIGKSLFGILILIEVLRWLRQKKVVEFQSTTLAWPVVYATERFSYIFHEDATISHMEETFLGQAGFLILDGKASYNSQSTRACIWLSSRPDTVKQTIKREGFKRLYMPPWTADELVDCWKHGCASKDLFYKEPDVTELHWEMAFEVIAELGVDAPNPEWQEAVLRHWVNELGPVPRRVFIPGEGLDSVMKALSDEKDYSSLLHAYQGTLETTAKFPHSHTLLLMIPIEDNRSFIFAPATTRIARRVLELKGENDMLQAQTLMGKMSGAHLGHVFQPYVEHILSMGGNFDVRSLEDNSPDTMDIAPCTKKLLSNKQFDELKESKPNTLYIPEDPDFPAVDCWTNNVMFQATVSHNHPIASAAKRFLKLRDLKLAPRIVFVVPKRIAGDFSKQLFIAAGSKKASVDGVAGGWNDIQQFVLGV